MWYPGKLYRHKKCYDVAFEVIKSYYIHEKDTFSLRVRWYNIGASHDPWYMGIEERIRLHKSEIYSYVTMRMNERGPKSAHHEFKISA
jgi:hypothetical protein